MKPLRASIVYLLLVISSAMVVNSFKISAEILRKKVGGRFQLRQHLGSGSYGNVYSAIDTLRDKLVAVKLEKIATTTIVDSEKKKSFRRQEDLTLDVEFRRYKILSEIAGVPKVWWYGVFETNYQALVIDLYDTSLRDVVKKNNGSLAMSTIGNVARQLLPILENIHNHSIVHRDIKPHNIGVKVRGGGGGDDTKIMPRRDSFLLQQNNEYYFFDFGISKTFLSDDKHIRFRDDKGIKGTVTYASMNAMLGYELSRRDDLESLGYSLLSLMRPLPWYWVQTPEGSAHNDLLVVQSRAQSSLKELCRGFPVEFRHYFNHVRSLGFYEKPNYEYLLSLFRNI